jgi:hypothetical protein
MNEGYTQIEGKVYQKVSVVMLSTEDKKAPILSYRDNVSLQYFPHEYWSNSNLTKRHLYFLSSEEIKEEDWFFMAGPQLIRQCMRIEGGAIIDNTGGRQSYSVPKYSLLSKVIATTDPALKNRQAVLLSHDLVTPLPRPSNSFLEAYVREFNKDNVITEVLVEWLRGSDGYYDEQEVWHWKMLTPKVAPDNTITIKPVKEEDPIDEILEYMVQGRYHETNPVLYAFIAKYKKIK